MGMVFMTFLYWLLAGLLIVAAAGVLFFRFTGPERIWELFGPADLGDVVFETLERRTTPNDALACPSGLCPEQSDILPPVYPVDTARLRKAMRKALMNERRLTLVDVKDDPPTDRFVQRSERMHFPDTIIVRYIDLGPSRSTVAIYSRSQLGKKDFGVNAARIDRWIAKLTQEVRKMSIKTNA
jgi:uncharacterized protein (DUF1499 family)